MSALYGAEAGCQQATRASSALAVLGGHRPGAEFGVVIYDLETIHDAEKGIYADRGLFECARSEQIIWKRRSQIIEFAAVDLRSGERLRVACRPRFPWGAVRSPAARMFAEDHGHDQIVKDWSLPRFEDRWSGQILPFLEKAAGKDGRLGMIAQNGDNFDHYVLDKELRRLNLNPSGKLLLHRFDPIRTLKRLHGEEYGTGGQLRLENLHATHVPAGYASALWPQHQALSDCIMLREVLAHWQHLASALALEISRAFCSHSSEIAEAYVQVVDFFGFPRGGCDMGAPGAEPALQGGMGVATHEMSAGTAVHGMSACAVEFVPGVPWITQPSQGIAWERPAVHGDPMRFQ